MMAYNEIPPVEDIRKVADVADQVPWAIMDLFTVTFNHDVEIAIMCLKTSFEFEFQCVKRQYANHLIDLLMASGYNISDIKYRELTKTIEFKVSFDEKLTPLISTDVAVYHADNARKMLDCEAESRAEMILATKCIPAIIEDAKNGERSVRLLLPDERPVVVNKIIKAFEKKGYYVDYGPNEHGLVESAKYLDIRW
jgi:hypothetical protein